MRWKLVQHARELLREETGTVLKSSEAKLRVALAYPNTYHVGMSNLGFQKVYALLNEHPHVVCERVFLPDPGHLPLYRAHRVPLFTLESQTPVRHFDLFAFSLCFENDCLNVVTLLDMAGIPARCEERDDSHPLVLMGGVCPTVNPEPMAEFADAMVIGEGEEVLGGLAEVLLGGVQGREELLSRLAAVEGIYVPSGYSPGYESSGVVRRVQARPGFPIPIRKRWLAELDNSPTVSVVLTPSTEFGNMYLVEVGRGCGRGCSFCLVCSSYQPPRFYSADTIIHAAEKGLRRRDTIGLVGPVVSDHPEIGAIATEIHRMGGKLSVSSLRLETLTEPLLRVLQQSGQRTLAVAPEAGSPRLRALVHKPVSDEEIIDAAFRIFSAGIPNLRLYFQVGLPTETDDDVEAIVSLVRSIRHQVRKLRASQQALGNLTLSISSFVPKPWTPFQWEGMKEIRVLERRIRTIRAGLRREAGVHVAAELPKWSYLQAILARGDRRMGELLLAMHDQGGDWRKGLRQVNLSGDFYATRPRPYEETFPYDHIDVGVSKEALRQVHMGIRKRGVHPIG